MKSERFADGFEKEFRLSKNQMVSMKGRHIKIDCVYGALWVTWPDGSEAVLSSGESLSVTSKGKVCVVAFSESLFHVRKSVWPALEILRELPGQRPVMNTCEC